jgi:hypothetical protein
MNHYLNISPSFICVYLVAVFLLIVTIIQFFTIIKFKNLFKDLSNAYSKDKKLSYIALVDRIIHYRNVNVPLPSIEVIELISNYIKDLFVSSRVFIHLTNDKEIADKILAEGFKYSENFYKSSEELTPDQIDLRYKIQIHKYYGKFVIIMCIPNSLYQMSRTEDLTLKKDILAEFGISEYNPNNELSYKLPSRYIKGYIDISKKQIVENLSFQIDK